MPDRAASKIDVIEGMRAECRVCAERVRVGWLTRPDGRQVLVQVDLCACEE